MIKWTAFTIATLAVALPAHAQDARVEPDHIVAVLKDAGYPAEVINDDPGYRQILSKTGEYQFLVEMYDCVNGKACETLEFYSNFPTEEKQTKERLDAFPGERGGARIALDRRGEATMREELDINQAGGLSDAQFIDELKAWETLVKDFVAYLTQPAGAAPAAAAAADAAEAAAGSAPAQVSDAS